jgi:hypothetical protein
MERLLGPETAAGVRREALAVSVDARRPGPAARRELARVRTPVGNGLQAQIDALRMAVADLRIQLADMTAVLQTP